MDMLSQRGAVSERPSSVMMARDPEVLSTMLNFYAPLCRPYRGLHSKQSENVAGIGRNARHVLRHRPCNVP